MFGRRPLALGQRNREVDQRQPEHPADRLHLADIEPRFPDKPISPILIGFAALLVFGSFLSSIWVMIRLVVWIFG